MPTQEHDRAADLYGTIGVRPIIHMGGTTTRYGGTIIRPEAQQAMEAAKGALVDMNELNVKAGQAIARMLGAEAAVVSSGAAGALLLQAAAVIAGTDPAKIARLPDTEGMKQRDRHAARAPHGLRPVLPRRRRQDRRGRLREQHRGVADGGRDRREDGGRRPHRLAGQRRPRPGLREGDGDRAPQRRAGDRRRRVDAAAARQPVQVRQRGRGPRLLQRRQGHPRASGHRDTRGQGRPRGGRPAQRVAERLHRPHSQGLQGGDHGPDRRPRRLPEGRRGGRRWPPTAAAART